MPNVIKRLRHPWRHTRYRLPGAPSRPPNGNDTRVPTHGPDRTVSDRLVSPTRVVSDVTEAAYTVSRGARLGVESDTRLTLDSARLRLDSRDSTLTLSQLTRYPHSRVSRSKVQRHDGRICICNLDQPVPHHTFSFVFISCRFRHLHHLRTLSFFPLKDAWQPSHKLVKYGSQ